MNTGWKLLSASVGVVGLCCLLLARGPGSGSANGPTAGHLVFYCAAGIKHPVSEAAEEYQRTYGIPVQLQFGGSGTLLSNLTVAKRGDLYLAADTSYIEIAREKGLLAEAIPLARLHPVIGVRKGNPKDIQGLEDLLREDVRMAIANPDAASIGKQTRKILKTTGHWERAKGAAAVFHPTVGEVANSVLIGAVDAGVIWDATANQYDEIDTVEVPAFQNAVKHVTAGILKSSTSPTAALRFCRYLAAPERGTKSFKKWGFEPVTGDAWHESPELVFYSGGVNRVAIQDTIREFEKREGVKVTTVFNGCGILVGQMKAGERPDAYFACDVSFMHQVADLFLDSEEISNTDVIIAVPKGNPKNIRSLNDLTADGLRLGVANDRQSALGGLTRRILENLDLYEAVKKNVKSQAPTADLLVNQIRTGSLDAVIVYKANTSQVRDALDIIKIKHVAAEAVQPFAASRGTKYPHLVGRLLDAIRSANSKERFEQAGFGWRAGGP